MHSLAPSTPLTGRRYLKEKEVLITPVSSATQSVSRLQSMVAGLCNAPTDTLLQIFKLVAFHYSFVTVAHYIRFSTGARVGIRYFCLSVNVILSVMKLFDNYACNH